jgi:hypothetical protein
VKCVERRYFDSSACYLLKPCAKDQCETIIVCVGFRVGDLVQFVQPKSGKEERKRKIHASPIMPVV